MPRLQPPSGYTTAKLAAERLGVSDSLLSRYVEQGKLHKYGPPERTHKFYKESEVEALLTERHLFTGDYVKGSYKYHNVSTFEQATEDDMPRIVDISARIFDSGPPIPVDVRLNWLRKNTETFFVLRNQQGTIVGYASLLPLEQEVIRRFIRDEIEAEDISGDDVKDFIPGTRLHLYAMAIGIDPSLPARDKHEYGARLVSGLFAFLLDLASRGIEIETITARSHKPDGLRLLRKMGIPELHTPVPGKHLFSVRVPDSGFYLFERYQERLREYKRLHATSATSRPAPRARATSTQRVTSRPEGTITLAELATLLDRSTGTLKGHFKKWKEKPEAYPELEHIEVEIDSTGAYNHYFTPEQVERIRAYIERVTRGKK